MNIINELGEHIGTKLAKAEELGNTGEVEESMNLFKEVDELKAKKTELEVKKLFIISIEAFKKFDFSSSNFEILCLLQHINSKNFEFAMFVLHI
jgi:hypothetical protein